MYWIIIFLSELLKLRIMIFNILNFKKKYKLFFPTLIASLILYNIQLIIIYLKQDTILLTLVCAIVPIIIISYSSGKLKNIFIITVYYISISVFDMILAGLIGAVIGSLKIYYMSPIIAILTNSLSILILLLISKVSNKKNIFFILPKSKDIVFSIILVAGFGFYIATIQFVFMDTVIHNLTRLFVFLGFSTLGLFFLIILPQWFYSKQKNEFWAKSDKVNKQMIEQQKKYYIELTKQEKDTAIIRHDIKKHFYCIYELIRADKIGEARDYLEELNNNLINKLDSHIHTGNYLLDIIVNKLFANQSEIKFILKGIFPEQININNSDFCSIFENLLENALEGVSNIAANKLVEMTIKKINTNLKIQISNPIAKNYQINNLKSKKKDKVLHGWGTAIVTGLVEQYNGKIVFETIDERFIVTIVLINVVDSD